MAIIDRYEKEKEILEFYRKASDFPITFREEFNELPLLEQAKLLSFVEANDKELYTKIKGIIND